MSPPLGAPIGWLLQALPPVGRDEARDAARRELSREIYHRDDPSAFDRALGALGRALNRASGGADALAPGGAVGALLLLALLVALIVAIRMQVGPFARSAGTVVGGRLGRLGSAEDHRREADRLAAGGAWAEAVRERLRAVVRELESRGVLEGRPGRTAGEVAAEAGSLVPAIATDLRAGAHAFDEIWYGGRAATADDDALLREVDERVRRTSLRVEEPGRPVPGAPVPGPPGAPVPTHALSG
ncbi:MAG: hypothetical protein NVSMB13_21220 [Mycobacteriales bacterium]